MSSIYSLELEKRLLACLIKFPQAYAEIADYINKDDFCADQNEINRTIFIVLKQSLDKSQDVDEVIIAQKIKELGITFPSDINVSDYIRSLSLQKVPESNIKEIARELKKYTVRRVVTESCKNVVKEMRELDPSASYNDIVEKADRTFNSKILTFDSDLEKPVNIFEQMEALVEERGENPINNYGMMGPHKRINQMYGSLLRPGNITIICARTSIGKTTIALDYCTKVSAKYDVPVLHFDNGEMSLQELTFRQCAAMSRVPLHLLESGKWRYVKDNGVTVEKVRSVWNKIKNLKFHYCNVGGENVDSMIQRLRRFYYSEVGRGNEMIFSFDYIKPDTSVTSNTAEYAAVGHMVDKFKTTIHKEIKHNNEPMISMFSSVQANRSGIVGNRSSSQLIEDEGVVSLSDRISQYCSHLFLYRYRTLDEKANYPDFGTHVLKALKKRHLGEDVHRALTPVRMPDNSLADNVIYFDVNGFDVQEVGDLHDLIEVHHPDASVLDSKGGDSDLPNGL